MLQNKIRIKKDDKVKVIAGKDKGKIGKVLKVDREKSQLLIEKINLIKRHTRASAKNRQGGIVEGEAPVRISNVMIMCNKCIKATRVKMQHLEDGKKIRLCVKCGEAIDT
ncbi:MAG: 50S ribosomal protein L24 [Desulfobacterales bacterium]|nr:50S ribosomal protein L24 [Desulfobacterales bacterium]